MIGLHVKHLLPFNYTLLGQVYNNETPLIQVELILGNFLDKTDSSSQSISIHGS